MPQSGIEPKSIGPQANTLPATPWYIVLESSKEMCLAKLSPYEIEKIIFSWTTPKKAKKQQFTRRIKQPKTREKLNPDENLPQYNVLTYPHDKLNTPKGLIRSREFSLATPEEIKIALWMQGVTDFKG